MNVRVHTASALNKKMTLKGLLFALSVCFLSLASATDCVFNNDCYGYFESCCSDGVCREKCHPQRCQYNGHCGTGECCDTSSGKCKNTCHYYSAEALAGIIVGSLSSVMTLCAVLACCYCACCPFYRHRNRTRRVFTVQSIEITTGSSTQRTVSVQQSAPSVGYKDKNAALTTHFDKPSPSYSTA